MIFIFHFFLTFYLPLFSLIFLFLSFIIPLLVTLSTRIILLPSLSSTPLQLTPPHPILPTQDALGPLSEEQTAIDRTSLPSYHRRIRRFHPDELLAISGFPRNFIWPKNRKINLEKCSGVVGNSINVLVVRCVMQILFGIPGSSSSSSEV
jgi:C-5 cytosine-specific DNA methylase